jgi:hypothetical protein
MLKNSWTPKRIKAKYMEKPPDYDERREVCGRGYWSPPGVNKKAPSGYLICVSHQETSRLYTGDILVFEGNIPNGLPREVTVG